MEKAAIISIIYNEPEWCQTERCLDRCGFPKFFVNRRGVGSLSKAINSGFTHWSQGFEYVWFVTDVTFSPTCLSYLIKAMDSNPQFAGITPAFHGEHLFTCPDLRKRGVASTPFIEFVAPIVRCSVFKQFPLDQRMPYWGFDLDWGYRVRKAGYKVGVLYDETVGHDYIKSSLEENPITTIRKAKRVESFHSTRKALFNTYGPDWRRILLCEEMSNG